MFRRADVAQTNVTSVELMFILTLTDFNKLLKLVQHKHTGESAEAKYKSNINNYINI